MNARIAAADRGTQTLAVVCVATAMLMLDIAVINSALPRVSVDLHASLSGVTWIIDAYTLALAATVLTAGSLADRYGRRLVFVAGLVLFTISSVVCALSTSIVELDAARAVQGIGGAAMFSTSLALLASCLSGLGSAGQGARRLRRDDRRLVRRRPARRRRDDELVRLALGVLAERADRHPVRPRGKARRRVA